MLLAQFCVWVEHSVMSLRVHLVMISRVVFTTLGLLVLHLRYVRLRRVGMLRDTTQALEAKNQVMKNAVHGSLALGDERIGGAQTRSAKRLTIPASIVAAMRGKIDKRTHKPQPICAAPVR